MLKWIFSIFSLFNQQIVTLVFQLRLPPLFLQQVNNQKSSQTSPSGLNMQSFLDLRHERLACIPPKMPSKVQSSVFFCIKM